MKITINKVNQSIIIFGVLISSFVAGYIVYPTINLEEDLVESNSTLSDASSFYRELARQQSGVGEIIKQEQAIFDHEIMNFNSPIFNDKIVKTTTYKYKEDIIVQKNIDLKEGVSVYIAEYHPLDSENYESINRFPINFVTFYGYENYMLTPSFVGGRVLSWGEPFLIVESISQDNKYYQELLRAPKSIYGVALTTFVRYYPGVKKSTYPMLFSLRKSFPSYDNDPNNPAKEQVLNSLKEIAQSIQFGNTSD